MLEVGAAIEVATAALPGAFLPLACTANLVKNLAAVSASTTRAPIYRTFALQNNLADVSAKVCAHRPASRLRPALSPPPEPRSAPWTLDLGR